MSIETISEKLGYTQPLLERIGAVSVLAGKIEYLTELAIWELKKENIEGEHPSTDGKVIGVLIRMLHDDGDLLTTGDLKNIIDCWTSVGWLAFSSRNTILHGVGIQYTSGSGEVDYIKDPGWHGEKRKRPSKTFIANEHTLNLLIEVFEALLEGILLITEMAAQRTIFLEPLVFERVSKHLRSALSVAREIDDLPAAFNHEKY